MAGRGALRDPDQQCAAPGGDGRSASCAGSGSTGRMGPCRHQRRSGDRGAQGDWPSRSGSSARPATGRPRGQRGSDRRWRDFDQLACVGLDERRGRRGRVSRRAGGAGGARRGDALPEPRPDRHPRRRGICVRGRARRPLRSAGRHGSNGTASPIRRSTATRSRLAGDPPLGEVLAIGDSLATDVLGAARMGIDCVFVTGGIHRGEPIPEFFAKDNDSATGAGRGGRFRCARPAPASSAGRPCRRACR